MDDREKRGKPEVRLRVGAARHGRYLGGATELSESDQTERRSVAPAEGDILSVDRSKSSRAAF